MHAANSSRGCTSYGRQSQQRNNQYTWVAKKDQLPLSQNSGDAETSCFSSETPNKPPLECAHKSVSSADVYCFWCQWLLDSKRLKSFYNDDVDFHENTSESVYSDAPLSFTILIKCTDPAFDNATFVNLGLKLTCYILSENVLHGDLTEEYCKPGAYLSGSDDHSKDGYTSIVVLIPANDDSEYTSSKKCRHVSCIQHDKMGSEVLFLCNIDNSVSQKYAEAIDFLIGSFLKGGDIVHSQKIYELFKYIERNMFEVQSICDSLNQTTSKPMENNHVENNINENAYISVDEFSFYRHESSAVAQTASTPSESGSIEKDEEFMEFQTVLARDLTDEIRNAVDEECLFEDSLTENVNKTDMHQISNFSRRITIKSLNLVKINFIRCTALRLGLKCLRCRFDLDDMNVFFNVNQLDKVESGSVTCPKCSTAVDYSFVSPLCTMTTPISIKFDIQGASVFDLRSNDYTVECEKCGSGNRVKNVKSHSSKSITCRNCYTLMSLSFGTLDILDEYVSPTTTDMAPKIMQTAVPKSKKLPKDGISLKQGQPLPDHGTCKHYKHSYRWLRFPCCNKAFPCDVCHDAKTDHPFVFASRMICGYCSLEQQYSQKPCLCGSKLTHTFTAHWEGGKGCRDKSKMSNKDNKKFKNQTSTSSSKKK